MKTPAKIAVAIPAKLPKNNMGKPTVAAMSTSLWWCTMRLKPIIFDPMIISEAAAKIAKIITSIL